MKIVYKLFVAGSLAITTLHAGACVGESGDGAGGGSDAESCGSPGRSGETDCPGFPCSAGMYCEEQTVGYECVVGCTSDANCGESEHCVKCGGDGVGTCQSCSKDEADVCGPGTCERNTALDTSCTAQGAKGYNCPTDTEPPPELGSCANEGGFWCCGGSGTKNPCTQDSTLDSQFCHSPSPPHFYDCAPDETAPPTCEALVSLPGGYCCP